jgi:hypothetical protein
MTSRLRWHRVYRKRAKYYAECALGTFRTKVDRRMVVLTLNDRQIGTYDDPTQAHAEAINLIEAVAADVIARRRFRAEKARRRPWKGWWPGRRPVPPVGAPDV